jgi:GntR family transcriptional regulator
VTVESHVQESGPVEAAGQLLEANTPPGEPTARVPKYYRLKRHLLELTQTVPPGTPVPLEPVVLGDARGRLPRRCVRLQ